MHVYTYFYKNLLDFLTRLHFGGSGLRGLWMEAARSSVDIDKFLNNGGCMNAAILLTTE